MVHLLFFAGSARADSLNKKLAKHACALAEKHDGVTVEFIDLTDYPMPIYDGDLEAKVGLPEHVATFKERLQACDGFFIASPEYNGFFSPLLKNAIDWASRPHKDANKNIIPTFEGKVAALSACSPGGLGGLRGLPHLRVLLSGIKSHVIPAQVAVGNGFEAFDTDGALSNPAQNDVLNTMIVQFITTTQALSKGTS